MDYVFIRCSLVEPYHRRTKCPHRRVNGMKFEEAVKQFLRHLELERGCTSCTVEAYTSDLRIFLKYLDEADIEPESQRWL